MAEAADAEDQLQELEALQSIFGEDLTVLDEAPVQLELMVPLELGGPRNVLAGFRRRCSKQPLAPQQELEPEAGPESAWGHCSGASRSIPEAPDAGTPGPTAASAVDHGAEAGAGQDPFAVSSWETYVPIAVRFAEGLLDRRDTPAAGDTAGSPPDGDPGVGLFGVPSATVLNHLPPLRLTVTFCEGYPSTRPPAFHLAAQWLSAAQLAALCAELDALALALPSSPVVFAWADWLQSGTLACLGLESSSTPLILEASAGGYDDRAVSELVEPLEVLQGLKAYDQEHGWWTWQQTAHTCPICFSDKPGPSFSRIGACGHTFCTECLSEMMRVHISEGTVASLCCPLPDCRREVGPRIVRQLADKQLYARWRRLQVQRILSELPGLTFCPRCEANGHETPVLPEKEDEDDLPLAICDRPQCGCAFCADCREAYHPGTRCTAALHRLERLGLKRAAVTAADKTRRQRLEEELNSLRMILTATVPCPKCKMAITRTQGCNHMICSNCSTHFCYRCGADITQAGYGHFRADKCPTFDREEVERMRDGDFGDGGGEEALAAELEELRRQYPEQANMVWNFRPPPGAWRRLARRRQAEDLACPTCRQWNARAGSNNHVRCRICKTNFCYACRKIIRGTVTMHFRGPGACPQHGDLE